jgi:SAM-dependent methyltransferase
MPYDRAMLAVFAELVSGRGGGGVADLGCGPGRITAHLHALGLDAFGVDLSPAMIEIARRDHPMLRFVEGRLDDLPIDDEALAGLVAWYSIIHTPPELLASVFAEFARTLAPGAPVLLAFQVGQERVRLHHVYGHDVTVQLYRNPPDRICSLLGDAGIAVDAQLVRQPAGPEKTAQAYLLGQKRW